VTFELMNTARLGTAIQGLSMGELARQWALAYAQEREQMRSLSGPQNPAGDADPILVHPDVRRMFLTQKAFIEGSRAFIYWLGQLLDQASFAVEPESGQATRTTGIQALDLMGRKVLATGGATLRSATGLIRDLCEIPARSQAQRR
jgi:alkylation response protein AidB-like acyl-CoA dehydrogenase